MGSISTLILAAGYYRWGNWRKARMLDTRPSSDAPDTGYGQPMVEESEGIVAAEEEELSRSAPSAPRKRASGAPAE